MFRNEWIIKLELTLRVFRNFILPIQKASNVQASLIDNEISLFLSTQSREEKLYIYRDFMTSYGVIEDLMCLNPDERFELVMELGLN